MRRKKKFLRSLALILLVMISLLAGCRESGSTDQFELYMVPQKYLDEASEKGTVETLTYHVESYAVEAKEGLPAGSLYEDKTLYVYLPYGYDASHTYDILYLLHGSNETEDCWFYTPKTMGAYFLEKHKIENRMFTANYTLNVLDNLFARGDCEPFIVVTPSYFSTLRGETDYGDSREDTMFWLDSFEQELRNDIIPLVERTYSTYAEGDVSEESIFSSREHRAIAGFSRGSRFTTRIAVPEMLDVFGWFGSFHGWETLTTQTLRSALEARPDCPVLYWYNGYGPKDFVTKTQQTACGEVLEEMSDVFREKENFAAVEKPEAEHHYDTALLDLYNFSHVLFQQQ